MAGLRGYCVWVYDDDYDYFETGCSNAFQFDHEGVEENAFVFCPYCGRQIRGHIKFAIENRNVRRSRFSIEFEPRDIWIGVYISGYELFMGEWSRSIYVCLIPMLPIRIKFRWRRAGVWKHGE